MFLSTEIDEFLKDIEGRVNSGRLNIPQTAEENKTACIPDVTYDDLCILEPQLVGLRTYTEKVALTMLTASLTNPRAMNIDAAWKGRGVWADKGILAKLEKLVGWYAANEDMKSEHFYNICVRYLFGILEEIEGKA